MPAPRPDWLPESLFPFQSRFIDLEGHRVHYVDEGRGPVLLCLHGNPTYSFLYRHLIQLLQEDFRCVALDYPGFGLSRAAPGYGFTPAEHAGVVEQFVMRLELTGIILMGQDYGGPIGLAVAGRRPARFQGIVLGNTFAWPPDDAPSFKWFSRIAGGPIGRLLIDYFNGFVNLAMPRTPVRGHKMSAEVLAAYRGPFPTRRSRYPTFVFPRELRRSRPFFLEVERNLSRLKALPALLVFGTGDPGLGADWVRQRFEGYFPRHTVVPLEGVGHYIQEEAPDQIAAAIQAWWPAAAA